MIRMHMVGHDWKSYFDPEEINSAIKQVITDNQCYFHLIEDSLQETDEICYWVSNQQVLDKGFISWLWNDFDTYLMDVTIWGETESEVWQCARHQYELINQALGMDPAE